MVDGRACAKGIRVHICKQREPLPFYYRSRPLYVDENLKKGIQTCFLSLLYNKGTLYELEHSRALHDIGVLLSKILEEICWSDRTMGSVLQTDSQHHTFRNGGTWRSTHSGAQCSTYDTYLVQTSASYWQLLRRIWSQTYWSSSYLCIYEEGYLLCGLRPIIHINFANACALKRTSRLRLTLKLLMLGT